MGTFVCFQASTEDSEELHSFNQQPVSCSRTPGCRQGGRLPTLFTLQAFRTLALNHPKSSRGLQLSNRWTEKIWSFVMTSLRSEACLWSCYLSAARRTFITQHEEFGGGYFGRPGSALRRSPDHCWVLGSSRAWVPAGAWPASCICSWNICDVISHFNI